MSRKFRQQKNTEKTSNGGNRFSETYSGHEQLSFPLEGHPFIEELIEEHLEGELSSAVDTYLGGDVLFSKEALYPRTRSYSERVTSVDHSDEHPHFRIFLVNPKPLDDHVFQKEETWLVEKEGVLERVLKYFSRKKEEVVSYGFSSEDIALFSVVSKTVLVLVVIVCFVLLIIHG